ncbi:nitrite reductase (NADH) small subunit [Streptomyces canus]
MTLAPETTDLKVQLQLNGDWFAVCELARLLPGRGVAALLPDGRQAALFRDRAGRLYAVDNRDPFSGAAVLSRGLTGSTQGRPFVASPPAQAAVRPGDRGVPGRRVGADRDVRGAGAVTSRVRA